MGTQRESPYVTEWMPMVGGFVPAQVIRKLDNGKCFPPRKPKRFIMNSQWLKNQVERMKEAGIKCFVESELINGITMMAIKEGIDETQEE